MAVFDILLFALFALAVVLFGALLGGYVYKVFAGEKSLLDGVASPIENALFRVCGIDTSKSQSFKEYTLSLMVFNVLGMVLLFCLLFFQNLLPLNQQNFTGLNWHLALNTAVSFTTNTNWQSYGGESTMSYFSQMAGLTVQNFLSAATGVAVAVALMKGLSGNGIGNFYVDTVKTTMRLLIPISIHRGL